MKKALSLTLVAIMLISTLVACDGFMVVPIDPSNTNTTTTTSSTEPKYTITAQEWVAFAGAKNFTAYTYDESAPTIKYFTENAVKEIDAESPDKIVDTFTFFVVKDGACHMLFQYNNEWWYMEYNEMLSQFENFSLETYGNISGIYTEDFFNHLVFNEETNVYEAADIGVEVYFEDGILVYFKQNGKLIFGNVGSTVIEVPESYKLWTGINN